MLGGAASAYGAFFSLQVYPFLQLFLSHVFLQVSGKIMRP
jgi:hypothetical protein